ncbi:MAG: nucleoside recognition domain-containing protein [bacterium]
MINYIWLFLIVTSIITAVFTGKIADVTNSILLSAKSAVTIAISLIGIMAFWLGIVKLAEKSGLLNIIAKIIQPITTFLFPEIPKDNPALGNIAMSFSANAIGVTNAATPIGIKAMQEMQELNQQSESASNSMCMFLAMNTAGFQLIPASAIAILAATGCSNPTIIIFPTLLATSIALCGAVTSAKIFEYFSNLNSKKEAQNGN